MRIATWLALWALTVLASACFYTEQINERPTPGIRVVGNAGPYFVGDVLTFDATKSIDNAPNELTASWQAWLVDEDDVVLANLKSQAIATLDDPFILTLTSHDRIKVELRVTDSQGATRLQPDVFTVVVGNKEPAFEVQSSGHREAPGQPFVLHRGINLIATSTIPGGSAFDPDGDEVTLDWQLLPPPGSQSSERSFEPMGDDGYHLVPDIDGEWEVVVSAFDDYGGFTELSEKFFVGKDRPPCLQGMDPLAIEDAYYLVDSADGARRFSVLSVKDALDPFPASVDSDPVLGQASFRWLLKAPGDADFVELSGFDEPDYLVDPNTYNPGDQLQLRVEVADRVEGTARVLDCGPEVWSCALDTGSGCDQRMTWGVDIR